MNITHPTYRLGADATEFDELVVKHPALHVERMSADCLCIVVGHGDDTVMLSVVGGKNPRVILVEGKVEGVHD